MAMLEAKDVSFVYQTKYQRTQALKGVSCTFSPGKFYAIVGPSGCGKTTFLSLLAGLGTPTGGEILFNGQPLKQIGFEKYRRENVSVIYQNFNLFPLLTVLENVLFPMKVERRNRAACKERARELLQSVGLTSQQEKKFPAMLSGGEQQRVAIARALASQAKVLLADEPTGNLDTENGRAVLDILKGLVSQQGRCLIIVTHDLTIASQADVVVHMRDGAIVSVQEQWNPKEGGVL